MEYTPRRLSAAARLRMLLLGGALKVTPVLRQIAAGYSAKVACSALFLSERELASIIAEDLDGIPGLTLEVNREAGEVLARVAGQERRAIFREGLGAVLLHPAASDKILGFPAPPAPREASSEPWPAGNEPGPSALGEEQQSALEAAVTEAFAEPRGGGRRTRAVVVVHRGRIVCERYAPGFSAETRLVGWSMTKSLLNALIGILVGRGSLSIEEPIAAPEWEAAGDPRRGLNVDQLLRMSSGLRFWEQYWNPLSHVSSMLFAHPSAAAYSAGLPLVAPPDSGWWYASGSTNILARKVQQVLGDPAAALAFPRRALFDPLGMQSAQLEVDASGHFVASSFCYATARDWARFGLLYLQDGLWQGERLLPEGWVEYSRRPTHCAPLGQYGAHFWLNAGPPGRPEARIYPSLPADLFCARGFEEQILAIIPSREAVILRLGQTASQSAWSHEEFVARILGALPKD